MVRRLILIRHGQTTYNATGRMQGHLDTKLSEVGYEQAKGLAWIQYTEEGVKAAAVNFMLLKMKVEFEDGAEPENKKHR